MRLVYNMLRSLLKPDTAVENSPYKLPIANELGLDHKKQKTILQNYALSRPLQYSDEKMVAYDKIVKELVEANYKLMWNLLSSGKDANGNQVLEFGGEAYPPRLPASKISEYANNFSEKTLSYFDEIFEIIVPSQFGDKALTKLANHNTNEMDVTSGAGAVPKAGSAYI